LADGLPRTFDVGATSDVGLQPAHGDQCFGLGRKAALGPLLPLSKGGADVNPVAGDVIEIE
jgi:hypothetical protein